MRSISLPHIRVTDANSLPTLTQLFSSHMSPASSNSELGALPTKPPQVGRVLNCPPLIPGHMRHQYAPPPLAGYLFLCCNRSRHVSDENTCCVFPRLFFSSSPRSDSNSRANISETMFEVRPQQATRKATKTPKQATRTRMQWVCLCTAKLPQKLWRRCSSGQHVQTATASWTRSSFSGWAETGVNEIVDGANDILNYLLGDFGYNNDIPRLCLPTSTGATASRLSRHHTKERRRLAASWTFSPTFKRCTWEALRPSEKASRASPAGSRAAVSRTRPLSASSTATSRATSSSLSRSFFRRRPPPYTRTLSPVSGGAVEVRGAPDTAFLH